MQKSNSRCTFCAAGCCSPTHIRMIVKHCWKQAIAACRRSASSPLDAVKRCHSYEHE